MSVKVMLEEKGYDVVTIAPTASIAEASRLLGERRIGAVVVTRGEGKIAGILSERDIVRVVGAEGASALAMSVEAVMTAKVRTCHENNSINEVMEVMTRGRFRHLPVEKDGRLHGIISIGDVVKRRIEEVEREAEEIKQYIATA
jgi:CBS domain-containing protein